ncbi:MAG TPA: PAS domain S-box protein [Planctomycetota bacterium]|nr:PAS domain S-box protein [Planctomycetota bacterium]
MEMRGAESDLFRLLAESVMDYAVFLLDERGIIRTWNRGAEAIKGYPRDEIIGSPLSRLYPPEDAADGKVDRLLARAAREGRAHDEGWRVRRDGTRFWATATITALRAADGTLLGFGKVTRDETARRAAEEALRQSEERFRLMVESVQDYAIFMLDPAGFVASWNPGAERIHGYRAAEAIGLHLSRLYPEDARAAGRPARELEQAGARGRFEEEGWRLRKDGSRFWANVIVTRMEGSGDEPRGFVKVTRDLTERRKAEEDRLQRAQAEEAVRLRDTFISVASHELRTPLAAVGLHAEILSRRVARAGEEAIRCDAIAPTAQAIARNLDRASRMVDQLLDVSRIRLGQFTVAPEEMDFAALGREVAARFRDQAAKAGSELRLRAEGAIPGRSDPGRIEQVLANLLANAIKFGAGKPVDLEVAPGAGRVRFRVRDQGIGISPEDQGRIFERFERAVSDQHFGGFGLGLWIARQLAAALGGTVRVESAPGRGATFDLDLPLRTP